MDQTPERPRRVDGDALMPFIAGGVSGVIAYTVGSGLFVAAVTTVVVAWVTFGGISLLNRFHRNH